MGKSVMRPSWTYDLGQNIISIEKKEKNLEVVIHNNLSAEKHIDIILGDTFRMAFHFLDKDMMRKILT